MHHQLQHPAQLATPAAQLTAPICKHFSSDKASNLSYTSFPSAGEAVVILGVWPAMNQDMEMDPDELEIQMAIALSLAEVML